MGNEFNLLSIRKKCRQHTIDVMKVAVLIKYISSEEGRVLELFLFFGCLVVVWLFFIPPKCKNLKALVLLIGVGH